MTERPTVSFTLPNTGLVVTRKAWITGREHEKIQEPVLKKYKGTGSEFDGGMVTEMMHEMLNTFLISIGDQKENLVDFALDLPNEDYQMIIKEIEDSTKKKSDSAA